MLLKVLWRLRYFDLGVLGTKYWVTLSQSLKSLKSYEANLREAQITWTLPLLARGPV